MPTNNMAIPEVMPTNNVVSRNDGHRVAPGIQIQPNNPVEIQTVVQDQQKIKPNVETHEVITPDVKEPANGAEVTRGVASIDAHSQVQGINLLDQTNNIKSPTATDLLDNTNTNTNTSASASTVPLESQAQGTGFMQLV